MYTLEQAAQKLVDDCVSSFLYIIIEFKIFSTGGNQMRDTG